MKPPIFVRTLSKEEPERLEARLRSKDSFALRRSQMLLASSRGGGSPANSQEPGMRPANGARRYPRLQREGSGCPHARLFTSQAEPP
jgi:hypothetical protein